MKALVTRKLGKIAHHLVERYKPQVVAVTGSVGKTSTRTAIALALGSTHTVRTPYKNYNNEIGVPLAILGEKSPGKNAWEWLKLIWRAKKIKGLPAYLVLEYGADHPGDLAYLSAIAQPDVAVITAISSVHVENYPNFEALIEEKASLGDKVEKGGLVLLNANDQFVKLMRGRYEAQVMTFGVGEGDVYATDIELVTPKEESFDIGEVFAVTRFTVKTPHDEVVVELKNCVGEALVRSAVAGIAVASHYRVPLADAATAISEGFTAVAGRLRPLAGIKGSLILDDTYNAAPASMIAGLETLKMFAPGEEWDRHVAVLGDMAELGGMSEAEHRAVGRKVAETADVAIFVGPEMRYAMEEAEAAGLAREKMEWFASSEEAGRYLDANLEKGDVVYVKGSQSQRMEKAVKDVMAEPLRAADLLVRQEPQWLE